MDPKKLTERKKRAGRMARALDRLYPDKSGTALSHKNPWQLLVATILAAQCTDKRVNLVTQDLFKKYKTVTDYAEADLAEFEEDIRSTGFYRNKAKNILDTAQKIVHDFDGKVPQTMDKLLMLPGVARKTANVVLSNCFGINVGIAVDTHVRRFSLRFDLSDSRDPKKIEVDLMQLLPQKDWFSFHNKLIYYGREICPARPHDCTEHPLTKIYPEAANRWPKAK